MEVKNMKNIEKLEKLIKEQHGTVLSSDLTRYDIPRTYLSMMVAEGKLEKMNRGVYASIDSIEDEMYAMQSKYPKLIFSHETALFLHGLTDRTPYEYAATVPSGYKVVETLSERFKIYYIKKDLHLLGLCKVKSSFGNQIMAYNVERTICDIIRSKSRIDIQIFNDALKRFVNKKSVDYTLLMKYAKDFKVEKKLKEYLEILL